MKHIVFTLFAFTYLISSHAYATAVEFESVPRDVRGNKCSSVILKGTNRFKGTVFILPRVLVSVNRDLQQLAELMPMEDGRSFLLRLPLYFPLADEDFRSKALENSKLFYSGCDINDILAKLNYNVPEADKIHFVAPLPVNYIKVEVQGVPEAYTFGNANLDLLHFQGLDKVAEFTISDPLLLREFQKRLTDQMGSQVTVTMGFMAKESEGYIDINISAKKIAAALSSTLEAKFPGVKKLDEGSLRIALKDAMQSFSADIYMESSDDDNFNQMAMKLIDRMIASNPDIITNLSDDENKKEDENHRRNLRPGSSLPDSEDPFANNNDEEQKPEPEPKGEPGKKPAPTRAISVNAVFDFLNKQQDIPLKILKLGKAKMKTYQTSTLLHARSADLEHPIIDLISGSGDIRLTGNLKSGSKLSLTPLSSRIDIAKVIKETHYFNKAELVTALDGGSDTDHLGDRFPILKSASADDVYDYPFVEGNRAYMYEGYYLNVTNWKYYVWGYRTSHINYLQQSSIDYSTATNFVDLALQMKNIVVKFQSLGNREFTFSDLVLPNNYWDAQWYSDFGRLELVPKKDLGTISMANRDKPKSTVISTKAYFQEKWASIDPALLETVQDPYEFSDNAVEVPLTRSISTLSFGIEGCSDCAPMLLHLKSVEDPHSPLGIPPGGIQRTP